MVDREQGSLQQEDKLQTELCCAEHLKFEQWIFLFFLILKTDTQRSLAEGVFPAVNLP